MKDKAAMHRVIVIGSVNHDRIWQLDDPLVRGGRLRFSSREIHLGGGGFFTGCQLLDLGADVALVNRLMRDEQGLSALKVLQDMGFDTEQVALHAGETKPLEILLEPNGERTILYPGERNSPLFSASSELRGDAAYLNALNIDAGLVAQLDTIPLVISQLPLRPATPRPADYVISSRDDAADGIEIVWHRAQSIAGPRLKKLVLTDGPRPITLFDGVDAIQVAPAAPVHVKNTIGAGDRFSGAFLYALLDGETEVAAAIRASHQTADWLRLRAGA
ncbi:sugar/nucleoside kinase (ribokinase family) [Neorhizobium sp. 2083]|uniref:PfkB family carbohydrate kinase n=1 Tax=Neorhizobium sp. 2083 TaxID=2817762 RepID=UPI0028549E55|nr:PfkB family carbohydrate kinase [Neorhizobium sp. 2083]MDR6817527.1 sugar/nucleoside kinase (ribokinase family) [Neorhizobium sp. 2083]